MASSCNDKKLRFCLALLSSSEAKQALANDLADRYRSSVERKSLSFAMADPREYLTLSYGFKGDERAFLVAGKSGAATLSCFLC